MNLTSKSKAFCLLLIVCLFLQLEVRSQSCIDSIDSKQFNVENFGGTFWGGGFQDNYDNFYLMGFIRPLGLKSTLVKFNDQKKIIWSKSYNAANSDGFGFFRRFFGNDNEENLYYISTGVSVGPLINFLKVDSSGNFLYNRFIRVTNAIFGYFTSGRNTGKVFSTITTPYFSATGKEAHFVAADKNLNVIRWSKLYKPVFTNYINAGGNNNSTEIDDTTTIITTRLSYENPINLNDTISTFHILKINSLTGDIIQQKGYSISNQLNPSKSLFASPVVRNVNYANKQIIYQLSTYTATGYVQTFFTTDSNLNIINTANYFTNVTFNTQEFNSITSSEILLNGNFTQGGANKLSTVKWDRNLQLLTQKTYYSSQFVSSNYTNLAYKNSNNTFSYFVASSNFFNPVSTPIYLFDNTKNPNFEFDCSDKDAVIFQPMAPYIFSPDASTFISQPGFNYIVIDNPNTYTVQNNNFSEQKYCDLVSICTSLKIQGKSSFCLNSSNIDSFKLLKNSTCLRKTIWTVNNSQMQILQSSDTSVKVKFLQPFKGYIKAAYENCAITDSFFIEVDTVYNMKSGVYLGADTLQCIGKSITLSAATGFKKNEWQDGSMLNTFTTSDTGLFHIKVLDSCNTVFRDSVYISPNPKNLNVSFGTTLCEYDTAKISIPANLTNYTWQPLISSMQIGNTLLLFPTSTTVYSINAQSHNNCFITDTVQIKKKDCYGSMYFPTAFSPNGDSKNDTYKPGAIGILQSYSLIIYNRYGNMVFHTNDINIGWDGKYQNKVQTGGYTWICIYTFRSRKQETESGSFILLR